MRHSISVSAVMASALAVGLPAIGNAAVTGEGNVVVLVNSLSPFGAAIGTAYQAAHPGVTIAALPMPTAETIDIATYQTQVLAPVQAFLSSTGRLETTHYLVTTKGVPLRITGANEFDSPLQNSTYSSVDSELQLAGIDFNRATAVPPAATLSNGAGALVNPYSAVRLVNTGTMAMPDFEFQYTAPQTFADFKSDAAASNSEERFRYLTGRLDGYDVTDIVGSPVKVGLIERAQNTANVFASQQVVDDDETTVVGGTPIQQFSQFQAQPPDAPRGAAEEVAARGAPLTLDTAAAQVTTQAQTDFPSLPVLSVTTYGTLGGNASGPNYISNYDFNLANGAIFNSIESFNANSLAGSARRSGSFGAQGLIGDWIAIGGTAAPGHVFEPTTLGISHPEVYLPMLIDGFTLADAVWSGTETASWQNVLVGDPLMTWNVPEPAMLGSVGLVGLLLRRR